MKIARETYLKGQEVENISTEVLMYGAGTQSTGMLLMALNGEFSSVPDFAVFSDTGAEPAHVIEYKDYFSEFVKNEFGFDIITVQHKNLDEEIDRFLKGEVGRVASIPLFTENGIIMRQCTQDYKIIPSDKFIKKEAGIKRKNKEQENSVGVWMGISLDEMQRMKRSTQWWKVILYPLIENGYRRDDTIKYVKRFGLKEPPRSACYFCPFHSNEYWKYLYKNYPEEYSKAIEFDEKIRNYPGLEEKAYINKNRIPLKDVDFNQTDLFDLIDECDGYCGI
jgi:hypothetical protein